MAIPLAASRTRLPDESGVDFSKPEDVKRYIASLVAALTVALAQRQVVATAAASRLFISPNGTAYDTAISDAGAWVITKKADPITSTPV